MTLFIYFTYIANICIIQTIMNELQQTEYNPDQFDHPSEVRHRAEDPRDKWQHICGWAAIGSFVFMGYSGLSVVKDMPGEVVHLTTIGLNTMTGKLKGIIADVVPDVGGLRDKVENGIKELIPGSGATDPATKNEAPKPKDPAPSTTETPPADGPIHMAKVLIGTESASQYLTPEISSNLAHTGLGAGFGVVSSVAWGALIRIKSKNESRGLLIENEELRQKIVRQDAAIAAQGRLIKTLNTDMNTVFGFINDRR